MTEQQVHQRIISYQELVNAMADVAKYYGAPRPSDDLGPTIVEIRTVYQPALRALATLVAEAERIDAIDDWPESWVELASPLVRQLAAGFNPRDPEAR